MLGKQTNLEGEILHKIQFSICLSILGGLEIFGGNVTFNISEMYTASRSQGYSGYTVQNIYSYSVNS